MRWPPRWSVSTPASFWFMSHTSRSADLEKGALGQNNSPVSRPLPLPSFQMPARTRLKNRLWVSTPSLTFWLSPTGPGVWTPGCLPGTRKGCLATKSLDKSTYKGLGAEARHPGGQCPGLERPSCSGAWLNWAPHSWAELEALATHSWFQLHFPCLVPISAAAFQALMAELWLETRMARGSQLPTRL